MVSYGYNSQGFLQTTTDEVGHVTTATAWNYRGQPTSVTGINGVVTTYGYDGRGRMTSVTVNPGASQTQWSFTYTLAGDLATVTQPSGATFTTTWDAARRLTTIANNLGETINYTRDTMGNATGRTILAADGKTVTYQLASTFDELGRLIKQVGGASTAWNYAYDRTNLTTGVTDPRGATLGYGYDAVSRLVSETERDGGVVAHGYNGKSEETTYTDPRSLATTFVRDGFGDVIQETSADRGTTVYDYDARGLVISRTDARGKQTTFGYDAAGRLTAVSYPATPALNVTYTYDGSAAGPTGIGHITHVQDAAGTTDFTYDAVGRITSETRGFGTTTETVSYSWDPAGSGRLKAMTLPSGFQFSYSYDALGRPTSVGVSFGSAIPLTTIVGNITYLPFGPLQQIGFYNGMARYLSADLEYRPNGLFLTRGATTLMQRFFAFADHLNLTEINNDAVDGTKTQDFNYDAAQRLTYASGPYGSRFWQYDTVGNRLSEARTVAGTTVTSTYAYPATSNRLLGVMQGSATTRAFTYDAAGDTTQDTRGTTAYAYAISDAGRIAQLSIGSTVTANYSYDFKNRLSVRQTLNTSSAGTTHSIYDLSDHLVSETDQAGRVLKEYMWVGDEPVAVVDWTFGPNPVLFFVHADQQHRPELLTDYTGAVVWQATYEPFGTVSTITGAATENRRFPGQYFQIEAGLAYNWHRHYDATTGRYTTPDPLGVRAGASVYGYVGQSPVMVADPRGLCFEDACIGEAIALTQLAGIAYASYEAYHVAQAAMAAASDPLQNSDAKSNDKAGDQSTTCGAGANPGPPTPPSPAPEANGGRGPSHGAPDHNQAIDDAIRDALGQEAENIRKNQTQVDINGNGVGRNRPDLQYDLNGEHHNVEFDRDNARSAAHGETIQRNDPQSRCTLNMLGSC